MSKDKCEYNLDDLVGYACESFDNDYDTNHLDYKLIGEVMHEIADTASRKVQENIYKHIYNALQDYNDKKEGYIEL